jgi:hypothetical protein
VRNTITRPLNSSGSCTLSRAAAMRFAFFTSSGTASPGRQVENTVPFLTPSALPTESAITDLGPPDRPASATPITAA